MMKAKILLSLLLICLSGCGSEARESSQVLAKVDSNEISVHQLNAAIVKRGGVSLERLDATQEQVLGQLINRALLVNQAIALKLDRDPDIMRAVEEAKASVLAQAYLERLTNSLRITPEEARTIYDEHPEVFAKRKLYTYRQLDIQLPADREANFHKQLAQAVSIEPVEHWLTEQSIPFTPSDHVKYAEQIPLHQLEKMAQINKSQVVIFNNDAVLRLIYIRGISPLPMSFDAAQQLITKHWQKKKTDQILQTELARLQDLADINYFGKFAKLNNVQE